MRLSVSASSVAAQVVMDQSASETSSSSSAVPPTIVEVDLGDRSYPIYIGAGLLDQPHLLHRCVCFWSLSLLYEFGFIGVAVKLNMCVFKL